MSPNDISSNFEDMRLAQTHPSQSKPPDDLQPPPLPPKLPERVSRVPLPDDTSSSTLLPHTPPGAQLCDGGCQQITRVYLCVQCDGAFCNECWARQFPHKPGKIGADGLPHEKTDLEVVERLRDTLDRPDRTPEEQQKLHKNDEDTTWFGIARDEANMPIFQDYGRYAAILAEPQEIRRRSRYPQLVSFIGQTGMVAITYSAILSSDRRSRCRKEHIDKDSG
jgi:hypothetical protein